MKKNLFKKIILPILIVAIFLAPVSDGFRIKKAKAQTTDTTISIERKDTTATVKVKIGTLDEEEQTSSGYDLFITVFNQNDLIDINTPPKDGIKGIVVRQEWVKNEQIVSKNFGELTPGHGYYVVASIVERKGLVQGLIDLVSTVPVAGAPVFIGTNLYKWIFGNESTINYKSTTFFTTNSDSTTNDGTVGKTIDQTPADFGCGITKLGGCVLQILYVLWQASAWIATLAGGFLDFFIYYSTNSSSYTNEFVSQAWGAVRDIANILFIIALLYVAIKTILGLNVTDNKKLIGAVIIVGLIINFSLFTTKIVIDASNILAKVFYNNITSKDANSANANGELQDSKAGAAGQKSISVGLVDKFNPQNIVMKAYRSGLGLGYSIFIVILLLVITLYTAYIFFSIALLFLARVVSLWLAMIFSPMAFASYTVPFDIPGFGHKEWWKNLLDNAFLAPIFVFLLYIIVLFAGFLTEIVKYNSDSSWAERLLTIVIPFVILMALLKKAKELTVQYAGELGKEISGFGGKVAGLATGLASATLIGGSAALLQGGLGHLGKRAFESKSMTEWETNKEEGLGGWSKRFFGKKIRSIGGGDDGKGGLAGSSFDLRKGIAAGALRAMSGATGLNLGGQSKFLMKESGGYEADLKRRDEKRKKRAEGLKIKENEPEKQELNRLQEEHQEVAMANQNELHDVENDITGAKTTRESLRLIAEASNRLRDKDGKHTDPEYESKQKAFTEAADYVYKLEQKKRAIKNGGFNEKTGQYRTHNGNITEDEWKQANKEAENAKEILSLADTAKKEAETAHTLAMEEKIAAETAAKLASEAVRNARLNTPEDSTIVVKAVEDAIKAEEIASAKVAEAEIKVSNTLKTVSNTTEKLSEAQENATKTSNNAEKANESAKKGFGNSQNNYEDHLLPHQQHKVNEINRGRVRDLADNIENQWSMPWNKAARKKSAHEMRMGVKVESKGGGHGGHFGSDLAAGIVAEKIAGGHDKSHGKDAGKGGQPAH